MNKELITAGQFAKIASTTKRTIDWYTKSGLITPASITESGYRMYSPEQVIDFQVILLLRQLNFSIEQIKEFLLKDGSFKDIFLTKRKTVVSELQKLKTRLKTLDTYYNNLAQEGVFVKPTVKVVSGFDFYYLQKEGPYVKIYQYDLELRTYFKKIPKNAIFITLYEEEGYAPINARFKVGVIIQKGMELKEEVKDIVLKGSVSHFKALSYTFAGSPSLLSFQWKQLEKYAALHTYKKDISLPFVDVEVYKKSGIVKELDDENQVITEMLFPIQ